jgi:transcriptional regulator GlxA family with amidase domain
MEVLREIRLQRVRTALIDRGDRTVAEVALSCGFTHLGRFAGLYRARFGVSPSAVRRRP